MALRPVEDYVTRCLHCYRQMSALSLAPCPCRDPAKTSYYVPAGPLFQNFWRCAHHPSAMTNFFEKRFTCEHMCHTTQLEWWHGGMHAMPPYAAELKRYETLACSSAVEQAAVNG